MVRKILAFIRRHWEWLFLAFVLLILALYLTGNQLFGFSGIISAILALLGGLISAIVSFILAALILPLFALAVGFVTALLAAFTGIIAFLVGGIFTPIAALLTGWLTSIIAWLATTWLGTLLTPLYSILSPLVLKIAPWLTTSRFALKFYNFTQSKLLKKPQLRAASKPRPVATAASQSAGRGRSSAPAKRPNVPKRKRG